MPSRLSSLLVRDGLVGVKRMEKAFQRQVIYGGALDTILLESNLVPEERLVQYLSLATGLPPATRDETNIFDAAAIKLCPVELALMYRVVPLCFQDEALRVLVHDPVDMSALEQLANELDRAIQPMVVPEYRWHVVFDRMFGRSSDARFLKLAKQAEESAPSSPVGKPRTVIVDESPASADEEHVVVDVGLPPPATEVRPPAWANRAAAERQAAPVDDRPTPATGPTRPLEQPSRAERANGSRAAQADGAAAPVAELPEPDTRPIQHRPRSVGAPRPERPQSTVDFAETAPLSPEEARAALAETDDRDLIFSILLRAIRGRTWYAGLLTVQGGAAIGRVAIAGEELERDEVSQVLIPLDARSAFAQVVSSASPYIGPLATGDPSVDVMIKRLGGVVPAAAVLLPINLRNRVVAIAIGHRGGDRLGAADVAPLLPLAGAAAEALSRLIMKVKSTGGRAPTAEPRPAPAAAPAAQPARSTADGNLENGHNEGPELDFGTEVSMTAGDPDPIGVVLDAVESDDDAASEQAMEEALQRADETLPALRERFPGKLRIDRYAASGRPARAGQYGPILDLIVRLGGPTAELLEDKMRDGDRDVRFYATLCAGELRPGSLIGQLVERVFDTDYGVRGVALEALAGYPTRELETNLARARQALSSSDADRVQAAAEALAELGDVAAVGDLIEAGARSDRGGEHARRALVSLTKQNFGSSTRKWRSWWSKNKGRHRIEWLIDGLGHKDEALRRSSMDDLRKLTGEYFGYHHDLSKKEREAARERWERWWNDTGRRRFLRNSRDDEQSRSTDLLPARRD